jgi:DNA polymerase-3 subunit delta'
MSARFSEQPEASRLLEAAIGEGAAHAYLFHGPAGVGKRETARVFGRALLQTDRKTHPDLYELDPVGDMIRIDAIRELRRDLHMRPFEADRRIYLIHRAHLLNEDAADALLKDLEEPPSYAVVVLVADDLGPLPATIRSRCQLVPFRRLAEPTIRALVDARVPERSDEERAALVRVAAGRLDRLERVLDPQSADRRESLLEQARAVYRDPAFDPNAAAGVLIQNAKARASVARDVEEAGLASLDLSARESEQRLKRAASGAEREELLAQLEELGAWYRDLVAVAVGAGSAAVHLDKLAELTEDADRERLVGAERAAELVRETWRGFEELNLNPQLGLEALFIRLERELRV